MENGWLDCYREVKASALCDHRLQMSEGSLGLTCDKEGCERIRNLLAGIDPEGIAWMLKQNTEERHALRNGGSGDSEEQTLYIRLFQFFERFIVPRQLAVTRKILKEALAKRDPASKP